MQRFDREDTPEKKGDELRALNRGDHLTLLDVPHKGLTSNQSSSSDLHQGFRDVRDTAPIYDREAASRTVSGLDIKETTETGGVFTFGNWIEVWEVTRILGEFHHYVDTMEGLLLVSRENGDSKLEYLHEHNLTTEKPINVIITSMFIYPRGATGI
ncbi:unnamed protein product [Allacma fusca]|uniref:Uncharacterized protein n=1 Tax=Allacma fusca TaxID=39272 RepID=A0A8J2KST0_9HEXA|nr:unnamed protein product [Allacma fusca]